MADLGARVEQVLAVVQGQQQPPRPQRVAERLEQRAAGFLGDPDDRRDARDHQVGLPQVGQLDEPEPRPGTPPRRWPAGAAPAGSCRSLQARTGSARGPGAASGAARRVPAPGRRRYSVPRADGPGSRPRGISLRRRQHPQRKPEGPDSRGERAQVTQSRPLGAPLHPGPEKGEVGCPSPTRNAISSNNSAFSGPARTSPKASQYAPRAAPRIVRIMYVVMYFPAPPPPRPCPRRPRQRHEPPVSWRQNALESRFHGVRPGPVRGLPHLVRHSCTPSIASRSRRSVIV